MNRSIFYSILAVLIIAFNYTLVALFGFLTFTTLNMVVVAIIFASARVFQSIRD